MHTLDFNKHTETQDAAHNVANSETESFVRIEDKFLVTKSNLPKLLKLLKNNLEPSYMSDGVRFNMIESLYFDSASLKIFRDHFATGVDRFKLRLRQYGPNGKFSPESEPVQLEMKKKCDGISRKFRFKVGLEAKLALLAGSTLPPDFAEAKKKKELIAERCSEVNSAISNFNLRPQARVLYERQAFESGDLRVTIDDNLKTELMSPLDADVIQEMLHSTEIERAKEMIGQYDAGNVVIVEVKHSGTIPMWLQTFFAASQTPPASFSKYCYSISSHILQAAEAQS